MKSHDVIYHILTITGGIQPFTQALEMSDHPNKELWSEETLPEILFYVVTPRSKYQGVPVTKLRENGKVAESDQGKPINDFEILPRYIPVTVDGMNTANT